MTTASKTQTAEMTPLRRTFRWAVLRQSLLVMVVVGTLLNLINQGDALMAWVGVDWIKFGLTYCVPFFVSLYGAYSANRAFSS